MICSSSGDILNQDFSDALAEALNQASNELNDDLRSQTRRRAQHTRLIRALYAVRLQAVHHVLRTHRVHMVIADDAVVHAARSSLLAFTASETSSRFAVRGGRR